MERFRGRVALVTGASAGIGVAVARQLSVDHGMKVVGCARRIDRLKDLEVTVSDLAKASGSGGKFFGVECDLDKDEDIRKMFDWIRNHPELGQVDVCVANAGLPLKFSCLVPPVSMPVKSNASKFRSNHVLVKIVDLVALPIPRF